MHKEAVMKLQMVSSGIRIDAQLSTQLESEQISHRRMLMKLLSCVRYLARQGLPLRGHREDSQSLKGICTSYYCWKQEMTLN